MNLFSLIKMKSLSLLHPKYVPFKPTSIQLETTNACNLNCKTCYRKNFNIQKYGFLNYKNFVKIANQFKFVKLISLYGMGESFLNPDIFKMINFFGKNQEVEITTNGQLLNEDKLTKILNSNLNHINFSVDGATPETYKEARGIDRFNELKKIISSLVQRRNQLNSKLRISMALVITEKNKHELNKFVDLAKEIGVDYAALQEVNPLWYKKKIDSKKEAEAALKYAKKMGVNLNYCKNPINGKNVCPDAFFSAYITWDGYITPCCMLPCSNVFNFGNVLHEPFSKIWNNAKYQKFRKEISKGTPAVCRGCT